MKGIAMTFKKKKCKSKHEGFAKAVENVSKKGGHSKEEAAAIVASASRNASPEAKRKNPRLKFVK